MRVLVDMDGVLADWKGGIDLRLKRARYDGPAPDWTQWDGVDPYASPEERTALRTAVKVAQAKRHFYLHLLPIDGGPAAIRELARAGHDVWLCSTPDHTNPTCADDKIAWAEAWIGKGWGQRVILTHDKTLVRGDFLIDDKPEVTGAAEPEWQQILFDQPYNQHVEGKSILRSWRDPGHIATSLEALQRMAAAATRSRARMRSQTTL